MYKQFVEKDLMKLCSDCGILKMKTFFCIRNVNQKKIKKLVYNEQKSITKYMFLKMEKQLENLKNSIVNKTMIKVWNLEESKRKKK